MAKKKTIQIYNPAEDATRNYKAIVKRAEIDSGADIQMNELFNFVFAFMDMEAIEQSFREYLEANGTARFSETETIFAGRMNRYENTSEVVDSTAVF